MDHVTPSLAPVHAPRRARRPKAKPVPPPPAPKLATILPFRRPAAKPDPTDKHATTIAINAIHEIERGASTMPFDAIPDAIAVLWEAADDLALWVRNDDSAGMAVVVCVAKMQLAHSIMRKLEEREEALRPPGVVYDLGTWRLAQSRRAR